jgi:ribonuclease PH
MSVVDRKRRNGPSNAIPLYFPPSKNKVIHTTIDNNDNQEKEKKEDEKLFIQLSNIPTATGSSFIQSGNNILLASVYGPRPSFKRTFNDKAIIKISFHSSPFLSTRQSIKFGNINKSIDNNIDPEYQIIDSVINSTLETACSNLILLKNYPKSTIDIFVNLINTDNKTKFINLLPLIHNAVNLALIDSGIALKNFPTAVVTNQNVFINSIHSNSYNSDNYEDLANEELLTFYIPNLEIENETQIKNNFDDAIIQARSLRLELSQFCFNKL